MVEIDCCRVHEISAEFVRKKENTSEEGNLGHDNTIYCLNRPYPHYGDVSKLD